MKEIVEQNKILEFISGSFLYGTNIETSDTDYQGIFIAPPKFYLGLEKVEEVDLSITSKTPDGKNDSNAIDRKFNEFRKFVRLCADGNPNVIEQIFLSEVRNRNCLVYINDFGRHLLNNRDLFVSKLVKQRFIGYGISQIHKSKVKPDNFQDLIHFRDMFESSIVKDDVSIKLIEYKFNKAPISKLIIFHNDFATIGGLNFNINVKMTSVYDSVCTRLEKASHRQDGWLKHGLDLKFCSHGIRLMMEGKELLETGSIQFPLRYSPLLLDIRNGKLSKEEIDELTEQTKNELDNFESDLPSTPNFDKINKFLIETIQIFWKK